MKIKVCSVLLLLCLLCGAFCACGSTKPEKLTKLSSVYNTKWTPEAPSDTISLVSEANTSLLINDSGTLVLFAKEDSGNKIYTVYSLETKAVVYTKTVVLTSSDSVSLALGQIIELASDKYFLYDKTGKKITEDNGADKYSTAADIVLLDDTAYRINENTYAIENTFTYASVSGDIPEFSYWNNDYYYFTKDKELSVFDNTCHLVQSYSMPAGAIDYDFFFLYDGNVLIQYLTALPYDAAKYDMLSDNGDEKYNIHTLVFSPKNGNTKDYDVSYIISDVYAIENDSFEAEVVDNSVKNVAVVYPVNDFYKAATPVCYSIDSKCNIKGSLSNQIKGQDTPLNNIGNGYFVATTRDGLAYLLDKTGNIVGNISGASDLNLHYIATENKVYNYNLEKVLTMDKMTYTDCTSELLFFSNDSGECTAVKSDGSTITVADGTQTVFEGVIGGNIYGIFRPSEGTYSYYDASGNLLISAIAGKLTSSCEYDNTFMFICINAENITSYYIAYKK